MTSPEADINPVVAVFIIGFRYGSSVVKMNTDIESMSFSISGPSPGIFSVDRSQQVNKAIIASTKFENDSTDRLSFQSF